MADDQKQTVRWPATGRLLEVAAIDVATFVADGWEHLEPEPEPKKTTSRSRRKPTTEED